MLWSSCSLRSQQTRNFRGISRYDDNRSTLKRHSIEMITETGTDMGIESPAEMRSDKQRLTVNLGRNRELYEDFSNHELGGYHPTDIGTVFENRS